jgi:asparagine synthase (glutamine-hydrolysing)
MASRVIGRDLKTFTVGFPGEYDEQSNAEITANHLGVNSCVERVEGDELDLLPELVAHFDEPFADMSLVPTYQICKRMKDHATVILSGDGGDELFAGYPTHLVAWKMRHLDNFPDWLVGPTLKSAAKLAPRASWLRRNLLRNSLPSKMRSAFYQRDVCEEWQDIVLKREFVIETEEMLNVLAAAHGIGEGRTALDRAQTGDMELLLPDNMLVKVDRMSMKASVEVRSPFLDYRFAELVPHIPPALRVKNGRSKYLLRKLAERYLPQQIVHGPKRGFDAPIDKWLFNDRNNRVQKRLMEEKEAIQVATQGGLEWMWDSVKSQRVNRPAIFRLLAWKVWAEHNLT